MMQIVYNFFDFADSIMYIYCDVELVCVITVALWQLGYFQICACIQDGVWGWGVVG